MNIRDSLTLDASGLTLTRDGFLVGEARVARAGNVQQYYGYEIGLTGDEAKNQFGVYRDPDVVFDEKSMMSLAGRPVTRGHPRDEVTSANWKDLSKGQVGGTIKRDGEHVVAPMAIMDHEAAQEVANGARSLSAGYTVGIVRDSGTAPDGTPYEFKQTGALRFNHVAYLPDNNPRAGNTRIGDAWRDQGLAPITPSKKEDEMSDALKTVVLGDKAVQIAVSDVAAIDAFKAETAKTIADAKNAHQAAIAAKDAELAKKDAELDALKGKVLSDADLDKKVQARADLLSVAKAIAKDVKTEGLSDAGIRKAVVVAKLGDAAIAGKPDAYIDARFDLLVEDAAKGAADPFAAVVKDGVKQTDPTNVNSAAHSTMVSDMTSAWMTTSQKGAA